MKNNHSFHQTDIPLESQILNISVNMARIGNWIGGLESLKMQKGEAIYQSRVNLIEKLIKQTESYLEDLHYQKISQRFRNTLIRFKSDFEIFKKQATNKQKFLYWSEKALTWADILQNRAKLA